jgi:hypothetical protein
MKKIEHVSRGNSLRVSVFNDVASNPVMVTIKFGPHYYLRVEDNQGQVSFSLGTTHHGFTADASDVNAKLENIINHIKEKFPDTVHNNFK